jgi:hypothetical protein
MALLSRREIRLLFLRFSGEFWGADLYSKQQLHVWSQHKVKTLVLWEGKWYQKEHKMGSENSEFQAMVLASETERTGIC